MSDTRPKISTNSWSRMCCKSRSRAMKVPVRPTPALQQHTQTNRWHCKRQGSCSCNNQRELIWGQAGCFICGIYWHRTPWLGRVDALTQRTCTNTLIHPQLPALPAATAPLMRPLSLQGLEPEPQGPAQEQRMPRDSGAHTCRAQFHSSPHCKALTQYTTAAYPQRTNQPEESALQDFCLRSMRQK